MSVKTCPNVRVISPNQRSSRHHKSARAVCARAHHPSQRALHRGAAVLATGSRLRDNQARLQDSRSCVLV